MHLNKEEEEQRHINRLLETVNVLPSNLDLFLSDIFQQTIERAAQTTVPILQYVCLQVDEGGFDNPHEYLDILKEENSEEFRT